MTEARLQQAVNGCLSQDRNSQRLLYEYFHAKFFGICMRYAKDRNEAMDIFHLGLINIFNKLEKWDEGKGRFEAWAKTVLVNAAIDHIRRENRMAKTSELEEAWHAPAEDDVVDRLSVQEIMSLVQQLTPAYRAVFNLYVMEGFNHVEIAEKLGISEGASKSNLHKARAKLQQMITARAGGSVQTKNL